MPDNEPASIDTDRMRAKSQRSDKAMLREVIRACRDRDTPQAAAAERQLAELEEREPEAWAAA